MSSKDITRTKVKRLLASKEGREIIGEELGMQIAVDAKEVDLPIVACLIPSYKAPHPRMNEAFVNMQRYTQSKGVAHMFVVPLMQSSVVHWTRNELIRTLIESKRPYTHVLFMDDDIVPQPEDLAKMLSHKVDIIGALCTRRQDPPLPVIRKYEEDTGDFRQIWQWPDKQLLEVDAVGTGMLLISIGALQKVADAYFDCLYERDVMGMPTEVVERVKAARVARFDDHPNAWWFRFLPAKNGAAEYGEDISFCLIAKFYCGLKIHVDTTVTPEHIGDYGFSVVDFYAHRESAMASQKIVVTE